MSESRHITHDGRAGRFIVLFIAFVATLTLATGARAATTEFESTLVPGLGVFTISHGADLNNAGQVTGYLTGTIPPSAPVRAFLWEDGVTTDLGDLGGKGSGFVPFVSALSISEAGHIAGRVEVEVAPGEVEFHGFLWEDGEMLDLYPLVDARGVNSNRQVFGLIAEGGPDITFVPVFWEDGEITRFGAPPGATGFSPWSINESGVIAGSAQVGAAAAGLPISAAYLWEDGVFTHVDLTLPGDDLGSRAVKLTENGFLLGESHRFSTHGLARKGVVWKDGKIVAAIEPFQGGEPDSFWAYDINSRGQVVGISWDVDGGPFANRAAWWDGETLHDLNNLLVEGDPAVEQLFFVEAINDDGWILTSDWIGCCGRVLRPVPICPGDLNGDGAVGFADLLAVLAAWGPCSTCPEDLDGDGVVGFSDVLSILSNWGPCE